MHDPLAQQIYHLCILNEDFWLLHQCYPRLAGLEGSLFTGAFYSYILLEQSVQMILELGIQKLIVVSVSMWGRLDLRLPDIVCV